MAGAKRINMVSLYDSIYAEKTEPAEPEQEPEPDAVAVVAPVAAPPLSGDAGDEIGYVFPGKAEESGGGRAASAGDLDDVDELAGALTALIVSELAAGVDKK